jgi:2-succinyl-5-enolpyruvyl-6-hydroxy-3-cyclohexene-1-carboxylate synthase
VNPSTALATAVVDELVRGGVREAVLSPGSRNAPLSFALHAADRAGRLRLHVRIDERTAGFLALGLSKAARRPVAVVTTSGTAAVNLHPAVVEADYSGVPLVLLTADRPAELRGVGANQTIDQLGLYGESVRHFAELSTDTAPSAEQQRGVVTAALAAARTGPVHLDVAFRDPLVPDATGPTDRAAVDDASAPTSWRPEQPSSVTRLAAGPRTVVVAGDGAGWEARWVAEAASWPLLAEPSSGSRSGPNALAAYRLLLDRLGPEIERVVVFGRPTLSRPVTELLSRGDVELVVVPGSGRVVDLGPIRPLVAEAVAPAWVDKEAQRAQPDDWLLLWLRTDSCARRAVADVLDDTLTGPSVARLVAATLPAHGLLVAGSSSAVRDLDLADPWEEELLGPDRAVRPARHRRVLANRGRRASTARSPRRSARLSHTTGQRSH